MIEGTISGLSLRESIKRAYSLTLAATLSSVLPVHAQDLPQKSPHAIEEIRVTATRVETNIQETPLSVTAFTGDDLDLEGIDTGRELGIMVPNLVINPGPFGEIGTSTLIRGLPGVTTYVDGINFYNVGFLQRSFVEIEHVEVLRGPQGTLFGRNSNGGAIQIFTRPPADELGGRVDLEFGEFDGQTMTLAVDLPLADRLKSKWTAARDQNDGFLESKTAPFSLGNYDNSLLRADFLWEPRDGFSLRFNINEENRDGSPARIIRISNPQSPTYIAYNVLAGNPDHLAQARARDPAFPNPPFPLPFDRFTAETHEPGFPGGQLGKWQTRSDILGPTVIDQRYAILTLEWDITPQLSLESLTAYLQSDASQIGSYDGSEFDIVTDMYHGDYEGATQELHLIGSHFNGRLQSLLGLYYNDNSLWERPARWALWEFAIPNTGPNPGQPGLPGVGGRPLLNQAAVDYVHQWGRTVGNAAVANFPPVTFRTQDQLFYNEWSDRAFFGELTIGLLEKLDLKLGFRFSEGDSSFAEYLPADAFRPLEPGAEPVGDLYAVAGVIQSTVDNPDFGSISTPKVALAYQLNDDVFLYASYAEGFTQGEVTNDATGTHTLDPEVVETREIGLRSDLLHDRLRFNVTLFDSLWDGLRVFKLVALDDPSTPGQTFLVSVRTSDGVAQARGLEAELFYLFGERWQLDASFGLLNSEYLDIGDPPANGTGLQPGIPLAYAPELSYSLGIRYRLPVSTGGEVLFVGNYGWMDEYQRASESQFQTKNSDGSNDPEPAYGVLNAQIVYQAASGRWQLSLFGTNLTNEWYVNGGMEGQAFPIHAGYELATIGRPRELGVGLRLVFE